MSQRHHKLKYNFKSDIPIYIFFMVIVYLQNLKMFFKQL